MIKVEIWDAACFRDIANKLKDLIKGIREEQDGAEDMLRSLDTSLSSGVEFDEVCSFVKCNTVCSSWVFWPVGIGYKSFMCFPQDELQAELERLEKNLDESLFEKGRDGERDLYPKLPFTASSQHHGESRLEQSCSWIAWLVKQRTS